MRHFALAAACLAALTGCHANDARVSFTPAALRDCGANNAPSTIQVHWDASKAKPKNGVKLWINNDPVPRRNGIFGGDPGTLWTQGAASGSATTGNWAYPGTTVIVTDAGTADVLATVKIPGAPCT